MTADPVGSSPPILAGSSHPRSELEAGAAGDMDPVRQAITAGHRVVIAASAELAANVTNGTCTPGLRAPQPQWMLRYTDFVVVVFPRRGCEPRPASLPPQ